MNIFIPAIGKREGISFSPQIYVDASSDELIITGQIGSEIEQAVYIAMTLIRKQEIKIPKYMHVHFPHYEYEKVGISASLGIYYCLFACLTQKKLKKTYMMSGEIDIEGNVYGIGQINEKMKVFKKSNFDYFIIPYGNSNFVSNNVIAIKNIFQLDKIISRLENEDEI